MIGQTKECLVKINETGFDGFFRGRNYKQFLHARMTVVYESQSFDKIQGIRTIESPVAKIRYTLQILIPMVQDEIMRRIIHPRHELGALTDDGNTLPPRKNGREQARDLYILFFSEHVRHTDRIVDDEFRAVKLVGFLIQK
jgi:hypothetical protein